MDKDDFNKGLNGVFKLAEDIRNCSCDISEILAAAYIDGFNMGVNHAKSLYGGKNA